LNINFVKFLGIYMFRIVQSGNSLPFSYPVDPTAEFQPGQIAQLTVHGNNVVCGVSDGSAPIGIIDDIRTRSFTTAACDEVVIAGPIAGVLSNGVLVTPNDVKVELDNPNISAGSFVSNPVDVELKPRNGVVVFLAGTPLNLDADGDGIPDSIKTIVSYTYQVPNVPGDDSTAANGRVTVWFQRLIGETDQYETNQRYPINANLFVSEEGKLTTRQPSPDHPGVAIVTASPTSLFSSIQFLWM
jgi:hypothetical protein